MSAATLPTPRQGAQRTLRRERLLARAPRVLATVVVVVLSLAGLRVVVFGASPTPVKRGPAPASIDWAAHGLAVETVRAYLTWDAKHAERRASALRSLAGGALGDDLGLQPPAEGRQTVRWAQVVQDQEALVGGRLVTVAAMVDGRGLLHVSVPLRRDRAGRLALAGYPALVGPPLTDTDAEPTVRRGVTDPGVERVAARAVANYLARDAEDLGADLAPGAQVSLPALALEVTDTVEVADLGPGGALVTVRARDPEGASFTLAYELGITSRERVYVTAIQTFPDQP